MSKYRIIERKYSDGHVVYACEKKFLWGWTIMRYEHDLIEELAVFDTLEEAKRFLPKARPRVTEEKIIFEK